MRNNRQKTKKRTVGTRNSKSNFNHSEAESTESLQDFKEPEEQQEGLVGGLSVKDNSQEEEDHTVIKEVIKDKQQHQEKDLSFSISSSSGGETAVELIAAEEEYGRLLKDVEIIRSSSRVASASGALDVAHVDVACQWEDDEELASNSATPFKSNLNAAVSSHAVCESCTEWSKKFHDLEYQHVLNLQTNFELEGRIKEMCKEKADLLHSLADKIGQVAELENTVTLMKRPVCLDCQVPFDTSLSFHPSKKPLETNSSFLFGGGGGGNPRSTNRSESMQLVEVSLADPIVNLNDAADLSVPSTPRLESFTIPYRPIARRDSASSLASYVTTTSSIYPDTINNHHKSTTNPAITSSSNRPKAPARTSSLRQLRNTLPQGVDPVNLSALNPSVSSESERQLQKLLFIVQKQNIRMRGELDALASVIREKEILEQERAEEIKGLKIDLLDRDVKLAGVSSTPFAAD